MLTVFAIALALAAQDDSPVLVPTEDGDFVELIAESADPNIVHKSAEDFANVVSERLRREPTRTKVLDPHVDIHVFRRGKTIIYRLVWTCRLLPATPKDADCHFDRRGTLLSRKTLQGAQKAIELKELREGKLMRARKSFRVLYGNSHSPLHFTQTSCSGSVSEGTFWCIQERFFTAKVEECK